ncbi:MAG: glycosyltransferase family 39 protein [Campylobacterales bacterium]|nr:glycosyltransferase family 39 protein [Campylobacterales bacterium]
MNILNRYNIALGFLFLFHFVVFIYLIDNLSISHKEAMIYFDSNTLLHFICKISIYFFGNNDFALRFPFIVFYFSSSLLLYLLTDDYFKHKIDRLMCIAIFMMLPGVNSAALLINSSMLVIFLTLLYLYLYKIHGKENYILLTIYLFIDNSFAILFLALFLVSLKKKDNFLLVYSLFLFGLSMSLHGFDISGRPRGYFMDTFGVYASIFSPILFLYFFYAIYRVGIKDTNKDMYWYISATALGLSFLFSLRQKVAVEEFAPYVVISIPIMVKLFMHSIRVRLQQFRKLYYAIAIVTLLGLGINFLVFVFHKFLYVFLENPRQHFAYKYHIAKDVLNFLKSRGITEVQIDDKILAKRLKFYGIRDIQSDFRLSKFKIDQKYELIDIVYFGKSIGKYYLFENKK